MFLAYCSVGGVSGDFLKCSKPRRRRRSGKVKKKKLFTSLQIGSVLNLSVLSQVIFQLCSNLDFLLVLSLKISQRWKCMVFSGLFWLCVLPWAYTCLSRFFSILWELLKVLFPTPPPPQKKNSYSSVSIVCLNSYFWRQTVVACPLSFSVLGDCFPYSSSALIIFQVKWGVGSPLC